LPGPLGTLSLARELHCFQELFPEVAWQGQVGPFWHAQEAAMWESKSESWRTYICFAVVGAIFIVCQVLSGGTAKQAEETSVDPVDRTYREAVRFETAGQGGRIFAGDPLRPRPVSDREQTD
jgi:hypothetical protein